VDAVIHPSVDEMVKAGIVDEDSIPRKGGDNPNIPDLTAVVAAWKKTRAAAAKEAAAITKGLSGRPNGVSDAKPQVNGETNGVVAPKLQGGIGAKTWS
jgi:hypothetical protein